MKPLDLSTPHLKARRRYHDNARQWSTLAPTLIITALVVCMVVFRPPPPKANAQEQTPKQTLDRVVEQNQELDQQIAALQTRVHQMRADIALPPDELVRPRWSALLTLLSQYTGEEIMLQTCVLESSRGSSRLGPRSRQAPTPPDTLTLTGLAESHRAMAALALELEAMGLFDAVDIVHTTRQMRERREVVAFELRCPLKTTDLVTGGQP